MRFSADYPIFQTLYDELIQSGVSFPEGLEHAMLTVSLYSPKPAVAAPPPRPMQRPPRYSPPPPSEEGGFYQQQPPAARPRPRPRPTPVSEQQYRPPQYRPARPAGTNYNAALAKRDQYAKTRQDWKQVFEKAKLINVRRRKESSRKLSTAKITGSTEGMKCWLILLRS